MNKHVALNRNKLNWYAVLIAVLGMGSLYFQVLRMPLMAALEMSVFLLYMIVNRGKLVKFNILFYGPLTVFFVLTSIINYDNGFYLNDLVIWIVNIIFILSIQSNMSFDEFMNKYTRVIVLEAVVSLICFLWADVMAMPLPFMSSGSNFANGYYLTPYYTVGWANAPLFHRNAGMFIEPGAHQIFLNFALLFLLSDKNRLGFNKRGYRYSVIVLVISILTTQSTSGYISLGLVIITVITLKDEQIHKRNKWVKIAALILLIVLIIVESQTGVIENKITGFSYGQGSSRTRYNDTYYGYYLAFQKPIFGHGMYMSNIRNMLLQYRIINISNGMASFAIRAGVLCTLVMLFEVYTSMKKRFPYGWFYNICIFLLFFLSVNTEGIFLNILFLLMIGRWKGDL